MKPVSHSLIIILVAAALLLGATRVLEAQVFDPIETGVIAQQISSAVSPENPAPGQTVTISLTAYGTNLNNATITWTVNGTQVQRGTGQTQFSFAAGKNGEAKRVVATIVPEKGPSITRTFTIAPQDVSIVYESDGYVPPFYKGKATYGKEGSVTLVAVPNLISSSGAHLNPSTLTYKWIVDNTVQGSKSGYGKRSFSYTGSILASDVIIQVEVSSADGSAKGKGTLLLRPLEPDLAVYERHPLYGILFNRELTSNGFSLADKEVSLSAIPYSTSAGSLEEGTLSYTWSINGATIPVPKNQSFATFRNSTGQQGTSLIGISVENTSHLLQSMRKSLSITF